MVNHHGSWIAPVKIVVVEDHAEIRQVVRVMLHRPPEWELVGEAGDGTVGVELVKRLQPHIVVMDIEMPGQDGIAATKQITASVPHARVTPVTWTHLRELRCRKQGR